MHKLPIIRIALILASTVPLAATAQQGLQPKPGPSVSLVPPSDQKALPVFLEAAELRGHADQALEAEGSAKLRRGDQAVFSDWMRYDKPDDEVTAVGHVRIERQGDVVEGERLHYNLETGRGFMEKPQYTLTPAAFSGARPAKPPPKPRFTGAEARGRAERLLFEGPGLYRAHDADYTTCEPGNNDWFIRSGDLFIDKEHDEGIARNASIVLKGTTIFYSPYLSFTLHQQRKSGFLAPHFGSSTRSGTELTVPYYWNIAPNMDATIAPRVISKRGVQLNSEFRYLQPNYSGESRIEVLPSDRQFHDDTRYAMFVQHRQTLPYGWSGALNYQKVSDDTYFTDLSTQIALTSRILLPREGALYRSGGWGETGIYSLTAQVQRWQVLQADPLAPVTPPYSRQPQVTLRAQNWGIVHSDFDLLGQFVAFDHPTFVNGARLVAYPSFTFPFQSAGAYFTPKMGLHFTQYALNENTLMKPDATGIRPPGFGVVGQPGAWASDPTRTLPIFTTEAGLVFERDMSLGGQAYIQTLEPKAYYVYIPYRDQSHIPIFDSAVQDINFGTIFAENQFSGQDRINDANQITLGVTSRFISSDTGIERLRVALAQRYYFQSQQVTIPGVPPRSPASSTSDLLAALSGRVTRNWLADVGWQYNTDSALTQKFNIGARYQPEPGKVLNLVYRSTVGTVRQTDISTQWPLTSQWTMLARWNYSLLDHRMLEGLAGFEYNGGCWVFRAVAHRFATAIQQTSTSIFLQLELNGVSRIGSSSMDILRRNIAGYVRDPWTTRGEGPAPAP